LSKKNDKWLLYVPFSLRKELFVILWPHWLIDRTWWCTEVQTMSHVLLLDVVSYRNAWNVKQQKNQIPYTN
jgi:hypothetical protein